MDKKEKLEKYRVFLFFNTMREGHTSSHDFEFTGYSQIKSTIFVLTYYISKENKTMNFRINNNFDTSANLRSNINFKRNRMKENNVIFKSFYRCKMPSI